MEFNKIIKNSFCIIGKLGATNHKNFNIKLLWDNANIHFDEISHLAKKDSNANISGFWGAMSSFDMNFMPWENNFSQGFYLAGVEVDDNNLPPKGWTKWTLPSFEFLTLKIENSYTKTFDQGLSYIKNKNLKLVGAIQDFINPQSGENYIYFPIKRF